MTVDKLKEEIAKMQKALSNPQLPEGAKGNLKTAIKNAEAKLAEAEKAESKPEPAKPKAEKPKAETKPEPKAEKPKAEKSKPEPAKQDNEPIPTKAELLKEADKVPVEELKEMKRVRIGCEMFALQHEGNDVEEVETAVGKLFLYPTDWTLFLGDGHPFTVIQDKQFNKRCFVLKDGEDAHLTVKKTNGTTVKVKSTDGGGYVEKEKTKKHKMTPRVENGIASLATKMKKKDCSIAEFIKETNGTPIDDSIWGRIAQWNAKKTFEKITKVGIEKGIENPRFIAETVDYSEIFRTIRYYSVCTDKGEWSLIPDAEKDKIAMKFENKGFMMQYSRAEIGRMYNYGDPTQKSYDAHWMECKTLAADAYKTRIESGKEEARPKYQKHYNTCRNQVLNEYNREFLIEINELARKHKEDNKGLTFRESFKAIKAKLKEHHS